MNKCFSFTVVLFLIMSSVLLAATSERPMLLRVDITKNEAAEFIRHGDFDIATVTRDGQAEIVADDLDFQQLSAAGLNPVIVHEDLVAFYQSRNPLGARMGGFPTLAEAITYMDSLHTLYPALISARDSVGYSYQGRPLWMVKISDNVDTDEDEPEFFINAVIHAREPIGLESNLRYMSYLLDNYGTDPVVTELVNEREIFFVPVINPDGYEYNRQTSPSGGGMWRKNRHGQGVDLNRNWGYMWGYDDDGSSPYPSAETYRGTGPFSEPEIQSLREFINSRHFKLVLNMHAYGDYFLYPWGYIDSHTPDQPLFAVIGDSATQYNNYSPGTAWELLYNTNGDSNDWQYGEQTEKPKIFGFVMEIGNNGDGFWPDPSRIPVLWTEVLPTLLYMSKICGNPYAIGAPVAPNLRPIGDVYSDSFVVTWSHVDSLNPAVSFELKEMTGFLRTNDSFESGTANWSLDGFVRRTSRRHSGSYSLFSGSQNNYNGSAVAVNPVTILPNDTLTFWTWYSIEADYDYAYVQLSTDGGVTFTNLPGNITTNTNPNGNNQGNGITGNSSIWRQGIFPLNDYAGQSVLLGLRYRTDQGTLNEGFYTDEFYPVEAFQQDTIIASEIADTLYWITGRTPGEYHYQVRARDAEGQWSGFSNRQPAIVHPEVGIDEAVLPRALSLSQNYPTRSTHRPQLPSLSRQSQRSS